VPKPRVLTVPNASPGARALFVWNLGPREEACSYQAVLTTTVAGLVATARGTVDSEMVPKRNPVRLLEGR